MKMMAGFDVSPDAKPNGAIPGRLSCTISISISVTVAW